MSKQTFSNSFRKSLINGNPVLVHCLALCPVIVGSNNLKDAFALAVILLIETVIITFIASLMLKKVPRFIRVVIYLALGIAISCPILYFVENYTLIEMSLGMKIYVPLLSVNSLTAVHCELYAVKHSVKNTFYNALTASISAGTIMVLCGALRDIIGKGTFMGINFNFPFTLPGIAMPFGCLLLLGFMAAGLKAIKIKPKTEKVIKEEEQEPEEISLDIAHVEETKQENIFDKYDSDYDYLLSSVDDFLDSITLESAGDEE